MQGVGELATLVEVLSVVVVVYWRRDIVHCLQCVGSSVVFTNAAMLLDALVSVLEHGKLIEFVMLLNE